MKVVKHGLPWWFGLEVTCPNCESELKIEESDRPFSVHRVSGFPKHGEFSCEACGQAVQVSNPKYKAPRAKISSY